jgi:hypothetical protein
MIVDFQHHFTPRELIRDDPGDRLVLHYDENGAPSYTAHSLLYDLDEHIRMMDTAGIDAGWLTSAAGMAADIERSKFCNRKAKQAERDYYPQDAGQANARPLKHADSSSFDPLANSLVQAVAGHDVGRSAKNAGSVFLHIHQLEKAELSLLVVEKQVNIGTLRRVPACGRTEQV